MGGGGSSDCRCNDWSLETYFIHPFSSAQSSRLLARVTFVIVDVVLLLLWSLSIIVVYKLSADCHKKELRIQATAEHRLLTQIRVGQCSEHYKASSTWQIDG